MYLWALACGKQAYLCTVPLDWFPESIAMLIMKGDVALIAGLIDFSDTTWVTIGSDTGLLTASIKPLPVLIERVKTTSMEKESTTNSSMIWDVKIGETKITYQ